MSGASHLRDMYMDATDRIRELEAALTDARDALVRIRAELRGAGPSCSREFAETAMQSAWLIAGEGLRAKQPREPK